MKVMLVNGGPHEAGCTFTALSEVAGALNAEGVETEIFQVGKAPVSGCLGCGGCAKTGRCVIKDRVNDFVDLAEKADGFVFGSPVHYAAATGAIACFMDRVFFCTSRAGRETFRLKPGAAIVSARRGGTTAALDQLNKYFTISQMLLVGSSYWNMVHGNTPDEVRQDGEGLQVMRTLGRNMAWLLKCREAGLKAGVAMPGQEEKIRTNFIR